MADDCDLSEKIIQDFVNSYDKFGNSAARKGNINKVEENFGNGIFEFCSFFNRSKRYPHYSTQRKIFVLIRAIRGVFSW